MILTQLEPSETSRVVVVEGEQKPRQVLSSRGIIAGSFVREISCYGATACEDANRKTCSIGRSIAQMIKLI